MTYNKKTNWFESLHEAYSEGTHESLNYNTFCKFLAMPLCDRFFIQFIIKINYFKIN